MKYFVRQLSLVAIALFLAGTMTLGKTKHDVTFPTDMMVNGALVKAGMYDLKYDEKAGVLEIIKGNKTIVSTPAHQEPIGKGLHQTEINSINNTLVSVTFGGDKYVVVIGAAGTTGSE